MSTDARKKTSAANLIKAREAKKNQYIIYDSDDDDDDVHSFEADVPPPKPPRAKSKVSKKPAAEMKEVKPDASIPQPKPVTISHSELLKRNLMTKF